MTDLLFNLKSCEPNSEEFMPFLYSFSFVEFGSRFGDICANHHQKALDLVESIKQST